MVLWGRPIDDAMAILAPRSLAPRASSRCCPRRRRGDDTGLAADDRAPIVGQQLEPWMESSVGTTRHQRIITRDLEDTACAGPLERDPILSSVVRPNGGPLVGVPLHRTCAVVVENIS